MPKYRVTIKEVVLHEVIVEATSEEKAREVAYYGDDRENWKEIYDAGWIEVGDVERVRVLREVVL